MVNSCFYSDSESYNGHIRFTYRIFYFKRRHLINAAAHPQMRPLLENSLGKNDACWKKDLNAGTAGPGGPGMDTASPQIILMGGTVHPFPPPTTPIIWWGLGLRVILWLLHALLDLKHCHVVQLPLDVPLPLPRNFFFFRSPWNDNIFLRQID